MCIAADATSKLSGGNAKYAHRLPSIREIVEKAIDKPIPPEYTPIKNESLISYPRNASRDTSRTLLDMSEGAASSVITATSGVFRSNRPRRCLCASMHISNRRCTGRGRGRRRSQISPDLNYARYAIYYVGEEESACAFRGPGHSRAARRRK